MDKIEQYMRGEHAEGSPCVLRVTLQASGNFRARLSFAPGMESAYGDGATMADAITKLERNLPEPVYHNLEDRPMSKAPNYNEVCAAIERAIKCNRDRGAAQGSPSDNDLRLVKRYLYRIGDERSSACRNPSTTTVRTDP